MEFGLCRVVGCFLRLLRGLKTLAIRAVRYSSYAAIYIYKKIIQQLAVVKTGQLSQAHAVCSVCASFFSEGKNTATTTTLI